MAKKTTTKKAVSKQASEAQAGPDAAARRARLIMAASVEPEVEATAPAREIEVNTNVTPLRPSGWKVEDRIPMRQETSAQERARYAARLADHERRLAIWEERQAPDYQREDREHRATCEVRKGRCSHHAHVRKPRPLSDLLTLSWKERRHLSVCLFEEGFCPEHDDSHLIPPRPLDAALEFCCRERCYPAGTTQAITHCLSVPVSVRTQRQAMLRRDKHAFGDRVNIGLGSASAVARPSTLSERTLWNWRAAGAIHDSATTPLRGPAE